MTTTNTHAAPWTLRRVMSMLIGKPTPNLLQTHARTWSNTILTGREAVARALYFEAVQGSKLDMLNYDNHAYIRGAWLIEADRRIASAPSIPDLLVLRWWGYTPAEWNTLPALVKADKREHFFQVRGL